MVVSRQVSPPLVAVGVFAVCLALGTVATRVANWVARAASPATLTVAVQSGPRVLRVVNLTDAAWLGCVVTVEGGWQSPPFAFRPGSVERLPYSAFLAGALPQGDRPSFTQAFHEAAVRCRDEGGHWQDAAVR